MHKHLAKKSLGQNFLTSKSAVQAAIEAANLDSSSVVLEIGPGKGFLTEDILQTGATLYAIEKDDDLVLYLQEKFSSYIENNKFILIHDDASLVLDRVMEQIYKTHKAYSVIANIPYNITGLLIRKLLTTPHQANTITLMVQYEVAKRAVAQDKKESLLSLSIKCYSIPKLIKRVPAGSFSPAPKVDSALLHLFDIGRNKFKNEAHESAFFELIHIGFAHKRKTLLGNLKEAKEDTDWQLIFNEMHINEKIRSEDLTVDQFISIASRF